MKRWKIGLIAICAVVLVAGVIAYSQNFGVFKDVNQSPDSGFSAGQAQPPYQMPDHVKFMFLFRHLANIHGRDRADLLEDFRKKTGLSDGYFNQLIQLALD